MFRHAPARRLRRCEEDMPQGMERRCPRLGHQVRFSYCLACGEDEGPCWKVADCWWEYFDVVAYLRENYPEPVVTRLLTAQPPSKAASLVALVRQARERLKE
ncbi:MAG: hypothetical protein ACLFPD_01970 [Desulfosudaceae bacterium]